MPYITEKARGKFDVYMEGYSPEEYGGVCDHAGELNYLLTTVCLGYIKRHGTRYQTFNDIVGVLTCMVQELYRRIIAPYEDVKIVENGDVL
jgi:hypothetical protein